jgi:peptidoglycan/xylan/chitin deacetylase (PgdA/CDA1 family)
MAIRAERVLTHDWRVTGRWYAKKISRRGAAAISAVSGWLHLWSRIGSSVRVLTYHHVADRPRDPFAVPSSVFDRQMRWLARRGLVLSLDDFVLFLEGRLNPRPGSVLITIDDGYDDLWSTALPVLERHNVPAVAFVPAGELERSVPGEACRRVSREELAALARRGVSVGSHSWHHRSLGDADEREVLNQVRRSRSELQLITGHAVQAFAYPFGTRRDFNDRTRAALDAAGYRLGFTSQHGRVTCSSDRLALPRIKIEGGDPFWLFRASVTGGMDLWRFVDRLASRFQAREATKTVAKTNLTNRALGAGRSWVRSAARNLSLLIASVCVALLLGEFIVKTVAPQKVYRFPRGLFVNDARLGYRLTPGFSGIAATGEYRTTIRINSRGWREDREYGAKPGPTRRVVSLGDSFTMGIGVDAPETFSKVLEGQLRRVLLSPIEVINTGVAGYNTRQALALLEIDGLPLKPDLALLNFYVGNDIEENDVESPLRVVDGYLQRGSTATSLVPTEALALLSRSHLYQFLWPFKERLVDRGFEAAERESERAHLAIYERSAEARGARTWESTFGELARARAIAERHGFELVVVVIPELLQLDQAAWRRFGHRYDAALPSRTISDYCTEAGIPVLDLLSVFAVDGRLRENYFVVDGHWTPRGHELAAGALRKFLLGRHAGALGPSENGPE